MAEPQSNDDFYIGYEERAPATIAGHNRRWILIALISVLAVASGLALAQKPFAVSFFDFGSPRTYEGVVESRPHPVLHVERPGDGTGTGAEVSTYLLVGFGKHGAESNVSQYEGRRIRLEATPIYRDDQTMLEVVAGTVEPLDDSRPGGEARVSRTASYGSQTLRGEIVDSKCHFGVMKPGNLKAHRACASLCIRGGVPPVFIVRQEGEPTRHLLLVGSDGRALNQEVLDFVAESIEITGELVRVGDQWQLRAEPQTFKRIG